MKTSFAEFSAESLLPVEQPRHQRPHEPALPARDEIDELQLANTRTGDRPSRFALAVPPHLQTEGEARLALHQQLVIQEAIDRHQQALQRRAIQWETDSYSQALRAEGVSRTPSLSELVELVAAHERRCRILVPYEYERSMNQARTARIEDWLFPQRRQGSGHISAEPIAGPETQTEADPSTQTGQHTLTPTQAAAPSRPLFLGTGNARPSFVPASESAADLETPLTSAGITDNAQQGGGAELLLALSKDGTHLPSWSRVKSSESLEPSETEDAPNNHHGGQDNMCSILHNLQQEAEDAKRDAEQYLPAFHPAEPSKKKGRSAGKEFHQEHAFAGGASADTSKQLMAPVASSSSPIHSTDQRALPEDSNVSQPSRPLREPARNARQNKPSATIAYAGWDLGYDGEISSENGIASPFTQTSIHPDIAGQIQQSIDVPSRQTRTSTKETSTHLTTNMRSNTHLDNLTAQSRQTTVDSRYPHGLNPVYRGYEESSDEEEAYASIPNIIAVHQTQVKQVQGDAAKWVLKYRCNFPGCNKPLKDLADVVYHKRSCHEICEKCDMEFESSASLHAHKLASAAHVACVVCGDDFHTAPARNRHMKACHPKEKDLCCPGCGSIFKSSAAFVSHLEEQRCEAISNEQFFKARTVIAKVKEVAIVENANEKEAAKRERAAEVAKQQNKLVDDSWNEEPLGLPGLDLNKKPEEEASASQSFAGPSKYVSSAGATGSLIKKLKDLAVDDPLAGVEVTPEQRRLVELYKRMVGLQKVSYEAPLDCEGRIIFRAVPGHSLYDPAFFRNILGRYSCPHGFCMRSFRTEGGLDAHLRSPAHTTADLRCPGCSGCFKTATALMAHIESTAVRCQIRGLAIYKEALEIVSGDFLRYAETMDGSEKVEVNEPEW